jgi:hypothetical protein
VAIVEEVLEAERARARQRVGLDEPADVVARLARPAAAAEDRERALRAGKQAPHSLEIFRSGMRLDGVKWRASPDRGFGREHVLGEREHHGAAPPRGRDLECARDELGNARGVVDAIGPLRQRREHRAEIDFLEGLAPAENPIPHRR